MVFFLPVFSNTTKNTKMTVTTLNNFCSKNNDLDLGLCFCFHFTLFILMPGCDKGGF